VQYYENNDYGQQGGAGNVGERLTECDRSAVSVLVTERANRGVSRRMRLRVRWGFEG
jgi:hypothetical protein